MTDQHRAQSATPPAEAGPADRPPANSPMRPMLPRLRPGPGCPIGTWVKLPSLETVELLARAGFDFVVVDLEHSPLSLESAYKAVVVAQSLGMAALARVPDRTGSHLQRLLDAGVDGILVPQIADAAQAQEQIGQMRFPPLGVRGMGLTSRAGGWGLEPVAEYVRRGNEDVLKAVQFEHVQALEHAAEILDTPGLNAAFLGMADLSLSSGRPADDPWLQTLVSALLDAASARGLPVGTAVATAAQAQEAIAQGFSYVMVSNDAGIFARAATDLRAATVTA